MMILRVMMPSDEGDGAKDAATGDDGGHENADEMYATPATLHSRFNLVVVERIDLYSM